jgi:hypothetical protein
MTNIIPEFRKERYNLYMFLCIITMGLQMPYVVFMENKIIAIHDTLSNATDSMPQGIKCAHIFNDEKNKIYTPKGKPFRQRAARKADRQRS